MMQKAATATAIATRAKHARQPEESLRELWLRDAKSEYPRRAAFARKMLLASLEPSGRPN
jgi:hypothetical protein